MSRQGYIYFLQAVGTPRVKIGKTRNLEKRLRELRGQQHPFPLRLLRADFVDDIDAADLAFKAHFEGYQVYHEWYELPEDFMAQYPEPEDEPVKPARRKKARDKLKGLAHLGNAERFRAALKAEGQEGEDTDPHRAFAYYQRSFLRLLMENTYAPREFLVSVSGREREWEIIALDEAIRLGRIGEMSVGGELSWCYIEPKFIRHAWYTEDGKESEYLRLVSGPLTYNRALDSQELERLRIKATKEY